MLPKSRCPSRGTRCTCGSNQTFERSLLVLSLVHLVGYPSGYFRREKAAQYPEDRARSEHAAEILDRIAEELPAHEGGPLHRKLWEIYQGTDDNESLRFSEVLSRVSLDVGFRSGVGNAKEFLGQLIADLESEGIE